MQRIILVISSKPLTSRFTGPVTADINFRLGASRRYGQISRPENAVPPCLPLKGLQECLHIEELLGLIVVIGWIAGIGTCRAGIGGIGKENGFLEFLVEVLQTADNIAGTAGTIYSLAAVPGIHQVAYGDVTALLGKREFRVHTDDIDGVPPGDAAEFGLDGATGLGHVTRYRRPAGFIDQLAGITAASLRLMLVYGGVTDLAKGVNDRRHSHSRRPVTLLQELSPGTL